MPVRSLLLLTLVVVAPAVPTQGLDCAIDPTAPGCETTTTTTVGDTTTTTVPVEETTTTTTVLDTTTTTTEDVERPVVDDEPDEPDRPDRSTTTTSTSLPLLEDGPPTPPAGEVVSTTTSTTAPAVEDDDDRTGRQVALVVTALAVLGVVFGLLTYWYWRVTRPATAGGAG